jgi:hypothetical protein
VSFECPECSRAGSLRIVSSIELPPDSRSDEIALQVVECSRCDFAGIAVYEESRRGALDSESVDHRGYRIHEDDLQALKKAIQQCSKPRNERCRCRVHRRLSKTNASGRWNALDRMRLEGTFAMKL